MPEIVIVGGGVGGLTLALVLHHNGVPCRVLEAVPEIKPLGVGVNILPHGAAELARLGLVERLAALCVQTDEANFFNRFGQLVHREPLGRAAGYAQPQLSIHRADLHMTLLQAVRDRLGPDAVTGQNDDTHETSLSRFGNHQLHHSPHPGPLPASGANLDGPSP